MSPLQQTDIPTLYEYERQESMEGRDSPTASRSTRDDQVG